MSVRLARANAAPAAPHIDPETGVEESADELLDLAAKSRLAPVSFMEAKARGYKRSYDEIFGEAN
jgi:hypothetical protein